MSSRRPLISPREWRWFWIVSGGLSLLVGGITALVLILNVPQEPKNALPAQSPFKKNVADTLQHGIVLSDYVLPAPGGQWLSRSWFYSRSPVKNWTLEEIKDYWVPPEELLLMRLPQTNEKLMEDFFKGIP